MPKAKNKRSEEKTNSPRKLGRRKNKNKTEENLGENGRRCLDNGKQKKNVEDELLEEDLDLTQRSAVAANFSEEGIDMNMEVAADVENELFPEVEEQRFERNDERSSPQVMGSDSEDEEETEVTFKSLNNNATSFGMGPCKVNTVTNESVFQQGRSMDSSAPSAPPVSDGERDRPKEPDEEEQLFMERFALFMEKRGFVQ